MSGGSYDYAYGNIANWAGMIVQYRDTPARRAFAAHLKLVADAMHAIEWVDSCDSSPGDEDEAIRACLAPGAEVEAAKEELQRVMVEASELLARLP